MLEELAEQAEMDQVLSRKRALADHHMKSRKRGRELRSLAGRQPGATITQWFRAREMPT